MSQSSKVAIRAFFFVLIFGVVWSSPNLMSGCVPAQESENDKPIVVQESEGVESEQVELELPESAAEIEKQETSEPNKESKDDGKAEEQPADNSSSTIEDSEANSPQEDDADSSGEVVAKDAPATGGDANYEGADAAVADMAVADVG